MIRGRRTVNGLRSNNKEGVVLLCDNDLEFSRKVFNLVGKDNNCFVTCHKEVKEIDSCINLVSEKDLKAIIQYFSFWKTPMGTIVPPRNVAIASLYSKYGTQELIDLYKKNIYDLDFIIQRYILHK